jgi:hypothetical protein
MHSKLIPRLVSSVLLLLVATWITSCDRTPKAPFEIISTKPEPKFQIEETSGLGVFVRINQVGEGVAAGDFFLAVTDAGGKTVEIGCLAVFPLDAPKRNQRLVMLVQPDATVDATIKKNGRYELFFLVGPSHKEAVLRYKQTSIGSFHISR